MYGMADHRSRHFPLEYHWMVKPLTSRPQDPPRQKQGEGEERQQRETRWNDSSPVLTTPQWQQSLDQPQKIPRNSGNPEMKSRNRSVYVFKTQFVKKSELNSTDSVLSVSDEALNSSNSAEDFLINEVSSLSFVGNVDGDEENEGNAKTDCNKERNERDDSGSGKDNILQILEELRLSVQEPLLPEEQLKLDDQLQEDELLAMESIYGDSVFISAREKDLRYFQIHLNIEASSELAVTANLNSSADPRIKTEKSDDFLYSFKIRYLPPIVLTCLLPKSYPSHLPPYFIISVQWLDPAKISSLCSMLDSIWNEQLGQEVLYQWAEWLRHSSLSYLGFDKEIIFGPYDIKYNEDKRAVSGSLSLDVDVPSIRSYNEEKCHENFLKGLHECCICFNEYAGIKFIMLPCQHFFCWKCMRQYSNVHVSEGTVSKLQCPSAKCGCMIPPGLLKQLLADKEFGRWESLMLQKALESMSDVVYCPRCETTCIKYDEQHAQCSKCFFSFCALCKEKRHLGIECMTPEMKLIILQERQNSSQLTEDQKQKEREMINEILSVKEILKDAKQCPTCKMAISRTEGCNKMVCNNCGKYFCYRCNRAIDGYDHFRGRGSCQLFSQQMVQNCEVRVNARQVVGQARAELYVERAHLCPNCRQFNAKVGNNNHILCRTCHVHYCYLCKKIVRRSSQHYGPKGCKQHTVG
ncbi:E3 ubiquitin-protein ligase RNF14-like isoform X2 [Carica papaya]|uniref:E3 ubiquitin-protein ligase RNF14-like isoform X2 n=1 Tax=Carica papaya TaxID=3649 RepID=UPI000B8D16FA|nr:E3 ubiquitin-protein ligase RNF14-like isoform X2 [Carica papaya]